nr:hypothetical protein [Roseibium limicola]
MVFNNLDAVFKVCGAWFSLQFVFLLCLTIVTGGGGGEDAMASNPLLAIVSIALTLLSSSSIAVAWHRFALLGDHPTLIHLHVGKVEINFMGKMLLIGLIMIAAMIPVFAFFTLLVSGTAAPELAFALTLVPLLWLSSLCMRFNIALPATAIERPMKLATAFTFAQGLGWRMVVAIVCLSLPVMLVGVVIDLIANLGTDGAPGLGMQIKSLILSMLLQVITTVLGISVITSAYRIALENQSEHPHE